jgi:hypothetical protein
MMWLLNALIAGTWQPKTVLFDNPPAPSLKWSQKQHESGNAREFVVGCSDVAKAWLSEKTISPVAGGAQEGAPYEQNADRVQPFTSEDSGDGRPSFLQSE